MSWQTVVIIAIVAGVLLSIPVLILTWKVFKRVFGVFDTVEKEMKDMDASFRRDPFADLDAQVRKMTSPGRNPFEGLNKHE